MNEERRGDCEKAAKCVEQEPGNGRVETPLVPIGDGGLGVMLCCRPREPMVLHPPQLGLDHFTLSPLHSWI